MGCGGCSKARKSFKHRAKKLKALKAIVKKDSDQAEVKPKSKKLKRNMSKRAIWLRKKRREERKAARQKKVE